MELQDEYLSNHRQNLELTRNDMKGGKNSCKDIQLILHCFTISVDPIVRTV